MGRNPYTPPQAVVDPLDISSQRPKEVTYAVRLLWISLAISAGTAIAVTATSQIPQMIVNLVLIINVIVYLLLALLVWRIAAGRNWARWLFLVLCAIALLFTLFNLHATLATFSRTPWRGIIAAVNWVLQLVPCCLLLTPRAAAWFRAARADEHGVRA